MNTTYGTPAPLTSGQIKPPAPQTPVATLGGILTALAVLLVLPRIALAFHTPQIAMQLLLGAFALGSPALWLVFGRKRKLGAFGFSATMVIIGFVAFCAMFLAFLIALWHV